MLWLLAAGPGEPHGPHGGECPAPATLRPAAEAGKLSEAQRACLEAPSPGDRPAAAFALWIDRLVREGATPEVGAGADAILADPGAGVEAADRLLELSERLAAVDPDRSAKAAAAARARSGSWTGPIRRAERSGRLHAVQARLNPGESSIAWARGLAAAGVTGPALDQSRSACAAAVALTPGADAGICTEPLPFPADPPGPPLPDELAAVRDVGRLWARALWGKGYATERDGLLRAADGLAEPARSVAARLGWLITVGRKDPSETALVAASVWDLLRRPAIAVAAASAHRERGDEAGAVRWMARASDQRP